MCSQKVERVMYYSENDKLFSVTVVFGSGVERTKGRRTKQRLGF